jgi:tripartite-type tricarboxylate transporter receptor subunit TctC
MKKYFLTLAAACALGFASQAAAQVYPLRPVTMIVPYPAGGTTDSIARIMNERMKTSLGQPVIIENVTGAGGSIGVGRVARAAPDGYTLSIGQWATHVLNGAAYALPYDPLNDFEPVALLASNPLIIVAKSAAPAKNLKELIAWIKANQDKVSMATVGPGSGAHISGVYFQNTIGARMNFVPYRGGAPAMQDLVAGQVDLMIAQATDALPHVRGGRIKGYAVTAKTRMPLAPDVPTVDEEGLPGFYVSIWHGIWAPKGAPRTIIARLNAAVLETMADPAVRQRLTDIGQEIFPRERQTPEALGAYQKAEIEKWWPIVKAAGIKPE